MTSKNDAAGNLPGEELNKNPDSPQSPAAAQAESGDAATARAADEPQAPSKNFSEKLEIYKIIADGVKWALGTIVLGVVSILINKSFKDREQGIAELNAYDKYASEKVVFAQNPHNRLMLANFFAAVTPSETLQKGWTAYLELVKGELKDINNQIDSLKKVRNTLSAKKDKTDEDKADLNQANKMLANLQRILEIPLAEEVSPIVAFSNTGANAAKPNPELAQAYETKGFQALLNKDLTNAIYNFTGSENAYNTFHNAYNIANYLRTRRPADEQSWKEAYTYIANNYSWTMPADVKKQLTDGGIKKAAPGTK